MKEDMQHSREISMAQSGASMVEYALLVALISVASILAVRQFGQRTACVYAKIAYAVEGRSGLPFLDFGDDYIQC